MGQFRGAEFSQQGEKRIDRQFKSLRQLGSVGQCGVLHVAKYDTPETGCTLNDGTLRGTPVQDKCCRRRKGIDASEIRSGDRLLAMKRNDLAAARAFRNVYVRKEAVLLQGIDQHIDE